MSALGQKQTFAVQKGHVRFTPESGHVQCNSVCPLCANSGHAVVRLAARWNLFRIGGVKAVDEAAPLNFVDER
jgi:hypothetical protein